MLVRRPRLKARATTQGIEKEEYSEEYEEDDTADDETDSEDHENTNIAVSLPKRNQVILRSRCKYDSCCVFPV